MITITTNDMTVLTVRKMIIITVNDVTVLAVMIVIMITITVNCMVSGMIREMRMRMIIILITINLRYSEGPRVSEAVSLSLQH